MNQRLEQAFSDMPVVAIIRGVTPDEVVEIGTSIAGAGVTVIEVPLNSPQPFDSIERLATALGDSCVIGCGTLLNEEDAERVANAGGQIAVTPNTNTQVITRCIELGMTPMPGWATPSEAFAAYHAGARYLKLFPAGTYGAGHIKAVKAVLPADAQILAVGGVSAAVTREWMAAGAAGFGIGSEIYKPGMSAQQVSQSTQKVVDAVRATQQ